MVDNLMRPMDQLRIKRQNTAPCLFQKGKHLHNIEELKEPNDVLQHKKGDTEEKNEIQKESDVNKDAGDKEPEKGREKTPAILLQLRKKMATTAFINRTKAAVVRRRRLEQPWMKGNEMRPFFHLWEQEQCTPKGRKLKRNSSLPRDFRVTEKARTPMDMGIVRECCSKIRSRLKTFPFE